jgi:hypothetical protein
MRVTVIAVCICVCGIIHQSFSVNRIVAKSGGDYTSINTGLSAANAGDTVFVKAGTYMEIIDWPKSGSASKYIVLKAFGDGPAIIAGGTATQSNEALVTISSKSYAAIIGMEIGPFSTPSEDVFVKGIQIEGTSQHIIIKKCKVHDIRTTNTSTSAAANAIGVFGRNATVPITDVVIDSCEVYNNWTGCSETVSIDGNTDSFIISHNHVHDNNNIGILISGFYGECANCGAADQARHGVISDNLVERCTSCSNPAYEGDCAADGIYSDGGGKSIIERNVVSGCDIGIEAGAELAGAVDDSMIIRDNLIYRCTIGGIFIGGYETGRGWTVYCHIVNNTLFQNDTQKTGGGEILIQKAHDNLIQNNIICTSTQKQAIAKGFNNTYCYNNTVNNNLFFSQSGSENIEGASLDAQARLGDPLFVNADSSDFHILPGSSAIDACDQSLIPASGERDLDDNARKVGTAIDMGAYEYGAGSSKIRQVHSMQKISRSAKARMVIDAQKGDIYILNIHETTAVRYNIDGRIINNSSVSVR